MATVELLVFSGMPNPSLPLSAEEQLELAYRVVALQEVAQSNSGNLGYAGVLVQFDEGAPLQAFLAFKEVIAVYTNVGELPTFVRDVGRALEISLRERFPEWAAWAKDMG